MWQLLIHNFNNFAAMCSPGAKGTFLGFPSWYKYLEGENIAGKCSVIFNFPNDIGKILLAVVEILLRIGGIVAVVFVMKGGFNFITSQGDPEKAAGARTTIINSMIGLVITIIAVVVVGFIARSLT